MPKAKKLIALAIIVLNLALIGGITYAAFMDKSSVLGSSFSVGSSDIKLLSNVSGTVESSNLTDELAGPAFANIVPYWQKDYLIKVYNKASSQVKLTSNALYETAQDPEDLRQLIFIEPLEWKDENLNGIVDAGEEKTGYGKKTLIKWKTEGINLGDIPQGEIKGLILRFSTENLSDSKQGASALFDFEFNATQPTP